MIAEGETRTALYRFYDADEKLLYVGITDDPWRRWREHVRDKPWYPQVKHQAVTWYDARTAAEVAEYVAIRCEGPRFNIAGAVRPVAIEVRPVAVKVLAEPAPQPPRPAVELAAPGPEPAPAEPVVLDHRRRTLFVILLCINWAFLPSLPGMPASWHSMGMKVLVISTIIPVLVFLLIVATSAISRLGNWLERTFTPSGPIVLVADPAAKE